MYENLKKALAKAIQHSFTPEDILDENTLREAAEEYVYEHDLDIKDHLRAQIDLTDEFDSALEEIDWSDIW